MKNIGKYNGIPCYKCDKDEYIEVFKKGTDNGKQIFIVDGTMVKQNQIVGYYDGNHVRDAYDGQFYDAPKPKAAVREEEVSVSSATGTEIKDINFSDYSSVVDNFFKELNGEA